MSVQSKKSAFYMVAPPPMFTYLDDRFSCGFAPLSKANIFFFKSAGIEKIMNYSGKKLESVVSEYCSTLSISVQDVNINDQDFPRSSIPNFTEWLKIQVKELNGSIANSVTFLLGSIDNHISSLVVACWRRQHDWSRVAILAEFRHFTWPFKLRDYEQIIEHFHHQSTDFTALELQMLMKKTKDNEECRSVEADTPYNKSRADSTEQLPIIDTVLRTLFFPSPATKLVSDDVEFDPSISLVNDKDEDD